MADVTQNSNTIAELAAVNPADEHLFAYLGRHLMTGVNTSVGYLRMVKNNEKVIAGDDLQYQTDYRIEANGRKIGYLDIERKIKWPPGPWTAPAINIARHPMKHWQAGTFPGRLTNKLLSFSELPQTSFWVGVRNDYRACMVVKAADIFAFGVETTQPTRHSDVPLPILRIPNSYGPVVDTPEAFANLIVSEVLDADV